MEKNFRMEKNLLEQEKLFKIFIIYKRLAVFIDAFCKRTPVKVCAPQCEIRLLSVITFGRNDVHGIFVC